MKTILATLTILSGIMAVGYIEDCEGHCLGNENWTMFFVMFGIMLISGISTLYMESK
jgi:hypothetical protein|tara:strand:+ start:1751 stop:1921 length:171 start_codon:yes stop_codon:yes gene_type:complete